MATTHQDFTAALSDLNASVDDFQNSVEPGDLGPRGQALADAVSLIARTLTEGCHTEREWELVQALSATLEIVGILADPSTPRQDRYALMDELGSM